MSQNSERLTAEQRNEFEETGLLHLPAAICDEHVTAMRDRLWGELAKKYQMHRDAPETWQPGGVYGLQQPGKEGAFARMACPALLVALDDLFAPEGWHQPPRWGTPLVTFPSPGCRWRVPHQAWHLDVSGNLGARGRFAQVTIFAFLATVVSKGGATVAVTRTHRLVQKLAIKTGSKVRSAEGRKVLGRADDWLKDLWSTEATEAGMQRFMEEGAVVDGVPLKVVEITGEPGDVVIMHPCILHTASANRLDTPRLVLREGIFRVGAGNGKSSQA